MPSASPRRLPYGRLPGRRLWVVAALAAGLAGCARPVPVPSFVLFFTAFSSDLDSEALGVVQDAATSARSQGNAPVIVEGYANTVGDTSDNRTLTQRRALVVAQQLAADGVNPARISQQPQPLLGDPGVVSRRVEIIVVPRSQTTAP